MSPTGVVAEGDVFLVPLRDRGYAIGVLSRVSGEGHAFGYFFGPRLEGMAEVRADDLRPDDAILVGKFGDFELVRGNWPRACALEPWDPLAWPMAPLARIDEVAQRAWVSTYDQDFRCTKEEEVSIKEAGRYPYDRLMGPGSVEIRLTKLIGEDEANK